MATQTYDQISTTTIVGSATSSITFSGFSSSYTDLIITGVLSCSANTQILLRLNGDTASNYRYANMEVAPLSGTAGTSLRISNANTSSPVQLSIQIPQFSQTNARKSTLSTEGGVLLSAISGIWTGSWNSVAAITSVQIFIGSGNFVAGSYLTLHGIKAA